MRTPASGYIHSYVGLEDESKRVEQLGHLYEEPQRHSFLSSSKRFYQENTRPPASGDALSVYWRDWSLPPKLQEVWKTPLCPPSHTRTHTTLSVSLLYPAGHYCCEVEIWKTPCAPQRVLTMSSLSDHPFPAIQATSPLCVVRENDPPETKDPSPLWGCPLLPVGVLAPSPSASLPLRIHKLSHDAPSPFAPAQLLGCLHSR